jgi:site-specific DNA recombinase
LSDGNLLSEEHIYKDDGWTGEMLQRPGLDAMRDAAVAGAFQVLYVYDRGRLSRVFAYQEIILEEILDKDNR